MRNKLRYLNLIAWYRVFKETLKAFVYNWRNYRNE